MSFRVTTIDNCARAAISQNISKEKLAFFCRAERKRKGFEIKPRQARELAYYVQGRIDFIKRTEKKYE